jgi:APA family basic amino acid/polyamine antiporter
LHPKYNTPYISIILIAGIHAILATGSLKVLVVIDVMLFLFSYILIYLSVIALRIKEPNLQRLFRIPVDTKGLILFCVVPIGCALVAMFTNGTQYIIGGFIGLLSGIPLYFIFKKKYGGLERV